MAPTASIGKKAASASALGGFTREDGLKFVGGLLDDVVVVPSAGEAADADRADHRVAIGESGTPPIRKSARCEWGS